jgi:hypothetical protein
MAKKSEIKEDDKKAPTHVVVNEFRDAEDFNTIHEAGKDVSHFEQSRLEKLVSLGLVEKK